MGLLGSPLTSTAAGEPVATPKSTATCKQRMSNMLAWEREEEGEGIGNTVEQTIRGLGRENTTTSDVSLQAIQLPGGIAVTAGPGHLPRAGLATGSIRGAPTREEVEAGTTKIEVGACHGQHAASK